MSLFNKKNKETINNDAETAIDKNNLKLNINIEKPGQKPMSVCIPVAMLKNLAKIGNGISGIVGNCSVDSVKLEEIFTLVENGATGEIMNVVAEDDTVITITVM